MDNLEINLVKQAQAGDIKAFEKLVEIYDKHVMQIAFSMMGNLQDAQDIYQETFIRVFNNVSTFRFQSHFKTWLTRIVINLSINLRRKHRIIQLVSIFETTEEHSELSQTLKTNENKNPDENLYSQELRQHIEKGLNLLSVKERAVFTLKQFQNYKIREIAEILNCAEGTVKNYLFRATQKMKNYLVPFYNV